jgi:hypothetical protein
MVRDLRHGSRDFAIGPGGDATPKRQYQGKPAFEAAVVFPSQGADQGKMLGSSPDTEKDFVLLPKPFTSAPSSPIVKRRIHLQLE